jgi:hypothetical protein
MEGEEELKEGGRVRGKRRKTGKRRGLGARAAFETVGIFGADKYS